MIGSELAVSDSRGTKHAKDPTPSPVKPERIAPCDGDALQYGRRPFIAVEEETAERTPAAVDYARRGISALGSNGDRLASEVNIAVPFAAKRTVPKGNYVAAC
jgi:hypothetical protein